MEAGRLDQIDIAAGDIVKCVDSRGLSWWTMGGEYKVSESLSVNDDDETEWLRDEAAVIFEVVSRATEGKQ